MNNIIYTGIICCHEFAVPYNSISLTSYISTSNIIPGLADIQLLHFELNINEIFMFKFRRNVPSCVVDLPCRITKIFYFSSTQLSVNLFISALLDDGGGDDSNPPYPSSGPVH